MVLFNEKLNRLSYFYQLSNPNDFYNRIIPSMNDQSNENKLIEGEDFYYTPEGYKCFTEKYHLKRGYCCKSGCRHCPYGYDKKTGTNKK
jgi:hypothetical protein